MRIIPDLTPDSETTPPSNDQVTLRLPAGVTAVLRSTTGEYGHVDDWMWPAARCSDDDGDRGCGREIDEGQPVQKLAGVWLHAECARKAVTRADVDEAWLLLADQVAERPHRFRSEEIRVVLRAVAAIASRVTLR